MSHYEEIFPVGFIVKDTAVIFETMEWAFRTPIFGGGFHP